MFTVVIDKATGIKVYKDGALVYTHAAALTDITSSFTRDFNIGKDSRTDDTMMEGQISDFRIYATTLNAEDILELYKTAATVDDAQTFYAYEFNEQDKNNINKNGIVNFASISNGPQTYDMKIKVLADGSVWARIHWLNVTTDKTWFTNANEIALCNKNNRYSRMGIVEKF